MYKNVRKSCHFPGHRHSHEQYNILTQKASAVDGSLPIVPLVISRPVMTSVNMSASEVHVRLRITAACIAVAIVAGAQETRHGVRQARVLEAERAVIHRALRLRFVDFLHLKRQIDTS